MAIQTRDRLKGGFELALFFARGIKCFDGTKPEALRSLGIFAFTFAVGLIFASIHPPKGFDGYTPVQAMLVSGTRSLMGGFLSLCVIALVCRAVKGNIWLIISACNWAGIPAFCLAVPFWLLAAQGIIPWDQVDRIFVILSCYFYAVLGCIFYAGLKLSWEFAGASAIAVLFAGQTVWDIIFYVTGVERPW